MTTEEQTGAIKQRYGWDNAWQEARHRLAGLESVFDVGTIRLLEGRGVREGWHCIDVGAGGGSIAQWLCQQVGPSGRVIATDIDIRFLESIDVPNLEVRLHDEEIDYISAVPDPHLDAKTAALFCKAQSAFVKMWADRGWDPEYGRHIYGALRSEGLVDIGAEGRLFMWHGGSPGSQWMRLTYEQGREAIIASGALTEAEVDTVLELWNNPDFAAMSQLCITAWGRRPVLVEEEADDRS